jgi:hypothetical protein
MGTACACAAVATNQGVAITTTRASVALCSKKGLGLTGYAPGDVVECGNNLPRVEPDADAVLGLRKEYTPQNLLLRSSEFDDAAWTSTATVTANTTLSPKNDLTADTIADDGTGKSTCQVVTNSGAKSIVFSVWVRAGTLTGVRLTLAGSGGGAKTCTFAAASLAPTYTRAYCEEALTDDVTACVVPGGANATGTVIAWGADLKAFGTLTSHQETGASAVTLAFETTTAPWPAGFTTIGCIKATVSPNFTGTVSGNTGFYVGGTDGAERHLARDNPGRMWSYNGSAAIETGGDVPYAYNTSVALSGKFSGTQGTLVAGAGTVGPTNFTLPATPTTLSIGNNLNAGPVNGIISRVLLDPNTGLCP